ncbi:MAG: alpha/beta hydrolase [Chloroflexota bacterium]
MKQLFILLLLLTFTLIACDDGFEDDFSDSSDGDVIIDDDDDNFANETSSAEPVEVDYYETACPIDPDTERDVDCGILVVPENRAVNNGRIIDIAVAILHAESDEPFADPIVFLTGGPGDGALMDLALGAESWEELELSKERDIIFVDQRGTGFSQPFLDCPELEAEDAGPDAERDCQERLVEDGVDLTAYNTAENAADIADLMSFLEIDSYNLFGVSYGTRLGLTIMRDHPAGIRSVVLDSPFPPNAKTPKEEAVAVWNSIQALFADCAADPDCDDAFPNLEDDLIDAVIALNEEPLDNLIGDDIVAVIEKMLFSGEEYGFMVPILIDEVVNEEYGRFEELSEELLGFGATLRQEGDEPNSSEGMYNSVICRDEYGFASEEEAEDAIEAAIPEPLQAAMSLSTFQLYETCSFWGAGVADPVENEAVVSDIPTLVLTGEYDPATPPVWGELTVETLSNGIHIDLPSSGHSVVTTVACAQTLTEAFVDDPDAELDDGCVSEIPLPDFELP